MAMLTAVILHALVNFADDIEAFMDAVGLQSAVLLGSSSGGYVAQQVAIQVPHRVYGGSLLAHRAASGLAAFADEENWLDRPDRSHLGRRVVDLVSRHHQVPDGRSRTGYATVCAVPNTCGWRPCGTSPLFRRLSRARSPCRP